MRFDPAGQGLRKQLALLTHPPFGQFRHRLRVGVTRNQLLDHGPPTHAQHIGRHRGQLDVGGFKHLLHAIDQHRSGTNKVAAVASQITQLTLRNRRNKARTQQTVLQQLGDPLRILDVGLATGHVLDMGGIHQQHFKVAFQNVEDRFPVFARALHRHVRAASSLQPVRESQQLQRHGGKGTNLFVPPALRIRRNQTGDDRLLMNIQTRATLIQDFHLSPPDLKQALAWTSGDSESDVRAHRRRVATVDGACGDPGPTALRARGTKETSTSMPAVRGKYIPFSSVVVSHGS
jgi:hypothetical protein